MGKILNLKINLNNDYFKTDPVLNFDASKNANITHLFDDLEKILGKEFSILKEESDKNLYSKVANIFKKNNENFNEKGVWTSYIAKDFIEYIFNFNGEETKIISPLILYSINVSFNDNQYHFVVNEKEIINQKLVNLINSNLLSSEKIKATDDIKEIKKVIFQKNNRVNKVNLNEIYFGIFDPFENKFEKEIKKIAEMNIDLYESETRNIKSQYEKMELKNDPLLVVNNQLNFYQKIAARSALNENTIIYGPPGTGKSEIIVNIIANSIVNQNKILVVSEKKTALDVLVERLNKLEGLCLFLNAIYNEDLVYKKINYIHEKLGNFWETNNDKQQEQISLKEQIYKNLSVQKYCKKWHDFYNKVDSWIKIDDMPKSTLDYDSFERELKELNDIAKNIEDFNLLIDYKQKNLKQEESVWSLIRKIFYFNEFKNKFLLSDTDIEMFFEQLDQFQRERAKSIFYDREEFNYDFDKRYIEFYKVMESINIEKDIKFFEALKKDNTLFEQQMNVFIKMYETCPNVMSNKNFRRFLINQRKNHKLFINTISRTPEYYRLTSIYNYLTKGKIKKWGYKLKKFSDKECDELREKFEAISLISSLTLPNNCTYLLSDNFNPNDYWKYLTCDLVYFYLNPKMKSEEMKFLIKYKVININQKMLKIVEHSQLSNYFNKINNVVEFEELNSSKEMVWEKTINQQIIDFIKENNQSIVSFSNDIYDKYIQWLSKELLNLDDKLKLKAKEMFQVAKVPTNRMKITNFITRYEEILRYIFPVWVGSPNDVSNYCEFKKGAFDIAIIDEASQMLMENALPILYRSKHYVVAGDDKQLKATVAFKKTFKNEEKIDFLEKIDFDIVESLLDRANVSLWNNFILKNHYRSKKEELISFSNKFIYNNELIFASINNMDEHAVEVIDKQEAYYLNSVNEKEAKEVIKQLEKNIKNYKSFLIITSSIQQSKYIEDLLLKSNFANKFNEMIYNNNLKIKNIENVQGFEADCVIFSICYARKQKNDKIRISGPIIQDGGLNRLNVAITRAKQKMIVIKSFSASEININRENKDALIFYNYIDFLDNLKNHYESKKKITNKVNEPKYKYGNQILEFIKKYIKKNKLNYICNYMLGNFLADIVVYNKDLNNIELVISLDYWSKYNNSQDFLSSVNTQEYLMNIGYKFIRIKELEWQFAKDLVKENILKITGWGEKDE